MHSGSSSFFIMGDTKNKRKAHGPLSSFHQDGTPTKPCGECLKEGKVVMCGNVLTHARKFHPEAYARYMGETPEHFEPHN